MKIYEKNLRDEFAMAALTGFLANGDHHTKINYGYEAKKEMTDKITKTSYEIADSMIHARIKV